MRAAAEAEAMTPWSPESTVVRGEAFGSGASSGKGRGNGSLDAASASSLEKRTRPNVRVAGLSLLAADLRLDAAVPAPVRLLLNTKLGAKMLRPLLRTEIGEVANRRAWFDRSKLTRSTLALYQKPLCVQGWTEALMEAARTRQKMNQRDVSVALQALAGTYCGFPKSRHMVYRPWSSALLVPCVALPVLVMYAVLLQLLHTSQVHCSALLLGPQSPIPYTHILQTRD
jgi:hypothetical protein